MDDFYRATQITVTFRFNMARLVGIVKVGADKDLSRNHEGAVARILEAAAQKKSRTAKVTRKGQAPAADSFVMSKVLYPLRERCQDALPNDRRMGELGN
jgi:hypothetical protein